MNILTGPLPSCTLLYSNWPHIKNLQLADPYFYQKAGIDILLGAEIYSEIVLSGIIKGPPGTPTAQQTELGWILFGKTSETPITHTPISINVLHVDHLLEKFFQLEEISDDTRSFTPDEQYCYDFYNKNTTRDKDGRFIVKLPFRTALYSTAVLGQSRDIALRQFLQLEKRFVQNSNFKQQYAKNINDYLIQNHMNELFDTESDRLFHTDTGMPAYNSYYLPHHVVIRDSNTSTPLRPVYNAGKPTSNGNSLNSILFPGPPLLNDLIAILINWRFHSIAFVSDIQQMYRQIRVHDDDITYQRILWRDDNSQSIKEYGINRLSFGLNYSPCAAIQTIKTLAQENCSKFPESSQIIDKDIYMDDVQHLLQLYEFKRK